MTNPTFGTIQRESFDLAYRIEGTGPTVLVIGSAIYYPRTFSADLKKELRLVFIDHRGFGKAASVTSREDYALEKVLADIEYMREKLTLGRVIVLGHSGHGYMALEYAKKYSEHVEKVVLVALGPSHSSYHSEMGERNWQESVCFERKARLVADTADLGTAIAADPENRFVTFCLKFGAKSWFDFNFDATELWRDVKVNMVGIDHLWGEAFRDLEIAEGLESFKKPVLLALGKFDYLVAPASAWEPLRSKFSNLTVRSFDKSSHTPQLEESEEFNKVLLRWIQES